MGATTRLSCGCWVPRVGEFSMFKFCCSCNCYKQKKLFSSITFPTLQRAQTDKLLSTPKFMHRFLRKESSHQQPKFTSSTQSRLNSLLCLLFISREAPVHHSSPLDKLQSENTKPLAKKKACSSMGGQTSRTRFLKWSCKTILWNTGKQHFKILLNSVIFCFHL